MSKCNVSGCAIAIMAKKMCSKHYYRVKRGGTPEIGVKQLNALKCCKIEGCGKKHEAKGLCPAHYARYRRHGDPTFINPKCNRDGNYLKRARANTARWKKDNKITYNAYLAARKSRIKQATPKWLNLKEIEEIYGCRPPGFHVDHIVPINGKNVCGLHVPWNLQYLLAIDNLKKSNKNYKHYCVHNLNPLI